MCGIAGCMSTYLTPHEIGAFEELFYISALRGWRGAGLISLSENKKLDIVKTVGTPINIISGEKWASLSDVKQERLRLLIGHTRAPTQGDLSIENVHPHQYGNLVGVHNGTMQTINNKSVPKEVSDSKLLIESIANKGIYNIVQNSWGAYCLVIYDKEKKQLSFLRNKERPLWFAELKGTLYWASEHAFLQMVIPRRFTEKAKYVSLAENKLITYDIDTLKIIEQKEVKKEYTYSSIGYYNKDHYYDDAWWKKWDKTDRKDKRLKNKKQGETEGDHTFVETQPGYMITKKKLGELLQEGCAWCSQQMGMKDYEDKKINWVSGSAYLCNSCQTDIKVH